MHPIERLRLVAHASDESPTLVAREAAAALAAVASDPAALVVACRRLIDRQPTCGPLWWLAARVLASPEPAAEARRAADLLGSDPTVDALAGALPPGWRVVVLGWPEQVVGALRLRPDVATLAVDTGVGGSDLADWLGPLGAEAEAVAAPAVAQAVLGADIVMVEALAASAEGVTAEIGSRPAAAVATDSGIPVWALLGRGRVLPPGLWDALNGQPPGRDGAGISIDQRPPRWDRAHETVPARLISHTVGPDGLQVGTAALDRADCPALPEMASWRSRRR